MSSMIQVPEIGLRISEKAWRASKNENGSAHSSFVSYVCGREKLKMSLPHVSPESPIAEQAHLLAEECMARFWAADRTCTVTVTDISMSHEAPATYLLRAPAEGAVTAGYGSELGTPAFRCILKGAFSLAIGFRIQLNSHETPQPDDSS